ncbi:hypothetical protein, partial [Enterobacter sichuanensis]
MLTHKINSPPTPLYYKMGFLACKNNTLNPRFNPICIIKKKKIPPETTLNKVFCLYFYKKGG